MRVGAMIFAADQTIKITELAPELEARGFDSLWVPEKTHLPTGRRTPWPGGDLPEWYKRTLDPFVTLSAAAAVTSKLRVGTGVALVPVRDPVLLAKEVASLDWQSNGRFEFGIGYGWNEEEYETHGVDLAQAPAIMKDKMALMAELWSKDEASYSGTYVSVAPSWSWPKPVQCPRPPVLIGARASGAIFNDIAVYADGWIPIEGYGDILGQIPKLRDAFTEAGRDPADAVVNVYSSIGDPGLVERYATAGVQRVIVTLPAMGKRHVMDALETYTDQLAEFLRG